MIGLMAGAVLLLVQVGQSYRALQLNLVQVVEPPVLLAALAVSLLTTGVQIGGWVLILRGLGAQLPFRQAIAGYSLSFLPRYIPGSVWGYLSRNEWLLRHHGVPYGLSNWSSILEVFFILFSGALLAASFLAPVAGSRQYLLYSLLILLVCLIGVLFVRSKQLFSRSSWAVARSTYGLPTMSFLSVIMLVVVYVLLWLCHGTVLQLAVLATGQPLMQGVATYSLAFYVGWAIGFFMLFVPSGFGVRETALTVLLMSVAGLEPAPALVVSVLVRFISLLAELIWVAGSVVLGKILHFWAAGPAST